MSVLPGSNPGCCLHNSFSFFFLVHPVPQCINWLFGLLGSIPRTALFFVTHKCNIAVNECGRVVKARQADGVSPAWVRSNPTGGGPLGKTKGAASFCAKSSAYPLGPDRRAVGKVILCSQRKHPITASLRRKKCRSEQPLALLAEMFVAPLPMHAHFGRVAKASALLALMYSCHMAKRDLLKPQWPHFLCAGLWGSRRA